VTRSRALLAAAGTVALLLAGIGVVVARDDGGENRTTGPAAPAQETTNLSLPGVQMHPPPWHAEHTRLEARLRRIGMPFARGERRAEEAPPVRVYVNNQPMEVPARIGVHGSRIAALHTHAANGPIHLAPSRRAYTLGDLFDVWGLRFGSGCIGPYCRDAFYSLRVTVDGRMAEGDPRAVPLAADRSIVVAFGTDEQHRSLAAAR
jgi:hypothetical protein